MNKRIVTFGLVAHPQYFWVFSASLPNLGARICQMVDGWLKADPGLLRELHVEGLPPPLDDPYHGPFDEFRSLSYLFLEPVSANRP